MKKQNYRGKKGNLLLEFLLGLIIGIVVFIFLYSMADKLFFPDKEVNYEQPYEEFIEKLSSIGSADIYAANSQIMKIEEGTFIFGINPQTNTNGRLGDGNLHVIFADEAIGEHRYSQAGKRYFMGAEADVVEHYYDVYNSDLIMHIPRPPSCEITHSCVCRCFDPVVERDQTLQLKAENLYSSTLDLQEFVQPSSITTSFTVSCQNMACQDMGQMKFREYIQGNYYTGTEYVTGNIEVYEEVPYVYENGFIINRIPSQTEYEQVTNQNLPDITPDVQDLFYLRVLGEGGALGHRIDEEKFTINFMKGVNGEIIVCLSADCFGDINEEIALYEFEQRTSSDVSSEEINIDELFVSQNLPGTSVASCGNVPLLVSESSKQKMWTLAEQTSQMQYTPLTIPMRDIILQDGIAEDEFVAFVSNGNKLQLQLYMNCGIMAHVPLYAIELELEQEGFSYDETCEAIDFIAGPANHVTLQGIFYQAPGGADGEEGLQTTITCPSLELP